MAGRRAKKEGSGLVGLTQAVAAQAYGLSLTDLQGRTRIADEARQVAMYLARVVLGLGARQTGREFGRNHKAVAHACRRVEEAREDQSFDRTMEWLETTLRRAAGATP